MNPKKSSGFAFFRNILLFVIVLSLLIYAIYWLWRRQPKPQSSKTPNSPATQTEKQQAPQDALTLKPKDLTITKMDKIKLEGKEAPNSYVAIFSNDSQYVAKVDESGNFYKEILLQKGINLFELRTVSPDLQQTSQKSITYWRASENDQDINTVYAGPVKTVFDNVLTVSTSSGEKKVRTTKSTQIKIPASDGEKGSSTKSALTDVRIGDYAIALGNVSDETLSAQSLQIIRGEKPQNTEGLTLGKTLTSPKYNLFSTKTNNKIVEFSLDKNSEVSLGDQKGKSSDITKDKNVIIITHATDDKKTVDLIYLLP